MQKHILEGYKIFPVLAWTLCISFSFFVYTIVLDLREATRELEQITNNLEKYVHQPPEDIEFQQ